MKLIQSFFCPLVLLFALIVFSGCGKKPLPSTWKNREITVDGQDVEWQDARVSLKDASVGMGLMNDDEYLYLTLSLMDRAVQAQIMRMAPVGSIECRQHVSRRNPREVGYWDDLASRMHRRDHQT